jgi:ferredoxin
MAHKIKINKEKCIGCGSCESVCPKTFGIKQGKAYAKKQEVEEITCEKDAESVCPVKVISIS